jgi:hypothetical protein
MLSTLRAGISSLFGFGAVGVFGAAEAAADVALAASPVFASSHADTVATARQRGIEESKRVVLGRRGIMGDAV